MEHLRSYYTLERHLEESARINKQFEILDAIWKLNKGNLSSALSDVAQYFPHYSLHEKSHSNTILNNIESFLGEERIKRLSPTNTWLILMSTYTHDLGMVVFQDLVHKEWLTDNFQNFLLEMSQCDNIELKKDSLILLKIQSLKNKIIDYEEFKDLTPISIKNAVVTIVAEYIRRIHHERSSDIITGADKQFHDLANSFYSDQIPKRLLNILGEVAYLHGVEFYEIFERLQYESNGISSDKINPRLIACLLRLGDLLDIDDSRFNKFTQKVFEYPESSKLHIEKHASIKHLLITPEAIEITSDCSSEDVFRLARNWFDWLENEVEKQGKEWSIIAPNDLGGTAPTIPRGKIKVYYKSQDIDYKLLNLRFQISNSKVFEIFEGSAIYDNAEMTFIREVVQNALDASKIQLWKDITDGIFDVIFKNHFQDNTLSHDDIIKKIKFPNDIPEGLYDSYEVEFKIFWKDKNREILKFEITDRGTGISNSDLIRMTSKVGESRKKDKEYQRLLDKIPFWLKPTGAFGLGLQSIFYINDYFSVITTSPGEDTKELIFRSPKKGSYSSVTYLKQNKKRGTKVTIEARKDKFKDIFGTKFNGDIISNYDYFTDNHDSMYIPKIKAYIDTQFYSVKNLKIFFFNNLINYQNESGNTQHFPSEKTSGIEHKVFSQILISDKHIYFHFYENVIGSEFYLYFDPDINSISSPYETIYKVRDIPIRSGPFNYHKLPFCQLIWNFMSPDSDKILSLTREKFISNKKRELEDIFLNEVIPESLNETQNLFSTHFKEIKKALHPQSIETIYFKIILTKFINNPALELTIDHDKKYLNSSTLPTDLVIRLDKRSIKMNAFFDFNDVILIKFTSRQQELSTLLETIRAKVVSEKAREKMVISDFNNVFHLYLKKVYGIKELHYYKDYTFYVLKKGYKGGISINGERSLYLKSILRSGNLFKRGISYSDEKYDEKLAINNIDITGFENLPYLSNIGIISPFKSHKDYIKFKQEFKNNTPISLIKNKLEEIIPIRLIDWIINNNPVSSSRNKNEIYEAYSQLVQEFLKEDLD